MAGYQRGVAMRVTVLYVFVCQFLFSPTECNGGILFVVGCGRWLEGTLLYEQVSCLVRR